MNKIVKQFQKKTPPQVLFLKGDEPFFRDEITRKVRHHLKDRGYEVETYDGNSVTDSELTNSLDSVGLFGTQKLVVVHNAEKIKKARALLSWVQEPSDSVVAIFNGKGAVGTPLGKALEEHALTFESKPLNPYKGEVEKWMVKEMGDMGKSLSSNLAQAIHNAVGSDLYTLRRALWKVAYHCDGTLISKDDVRAVILRTAGNQTYEITNAFGERNLSKALDLVGRFYQMEDEPSILLCASLLNHTERLIRAKSLISYGLDAGDAARVLGMHPFVFQEKLQPQLRNFDLDELVDVMAYLCELDIRIKGSGLDRRSQIELFLTRFLDRSDGNE